MKIIRTIVWVIVMLCAFIGLIDYVKMMGNAESAPQQAAGAAMAMATVVIPYVFARAVSSLGK